MPIFEYVCRQCHHRFETIVLGSQRPRCPKCKSRKLRQQISAFAVAGSSQKSSSAATAGACGT